MPIELKQLNGEDGNCLEIQLTGKLHLEDYEEFSPKIDDLTNRLGKLRLLVCMRDFEGWDLKALWEDIKFDLKHFNDIDLLAMVGDRQWEKWMAAFCQPFTTAEVRYFDAADYDEAKDWIENGKRKEPNTGTGLGATPY